MKPATRRWILLSLPVLFLLPVIMLLVRAPNHPVAYVRVVDEAGAPVVGAVVIPEGLRTKPGPYFSSGYGWRSETNGGVANPPVTTDREGYARVLYPKYVFERIETGTICVSVNHPEFVPDRPERTVATALPKGAPWRARVDELLNRLQRKAFISRPDPIVLKKGATVVLRVDSTGTSGRLFGQASGSASGNTNFWSQPDRGLLITHRLAEGEHAVRAVQLDDDGTVWFSDTIQFDATARQTNEFSVKLKRGTTVRGQLDSIVPRPVTNGRVVANVWPLKCKPQGAPPRWHGWATVNADGTFSIPSLPEGDLEIVALCDGFISTNGPGQFTSRYPQKHLLGTNELTITIGMERTARLEVQVTDDQGKPLKDVRVMTWPNVRSGEWFSGLLMQDCYNTADWLMPKPGSTPWWKREVWDYQGMSDAAGLAVLPNVPATVKTLAVDHPRFSLPAVGTTGSGKHRQLNFDLTPGKTNQLSVQLERSEKAPITHY